MASDHSEQTFFPFILIHFVEFLTPCIVKFFAPPPHINSQQHYANQPNYLLLVNGKDKQSFSTSYITQELLQGIVSTKVM